MPDPFPWHLLTQPATLQQAGWFVAEGRAVVDRVLSGRGCVGPGDVVRVLAAPAAVTALALDARVGDRLDVRAPAAMREVTGFNFHRGVIAMVRRPSTRAPDGLLDLVAPDTPLVMCEHLVDVDNVGALFRNARALGAAGVLLDDACADPLYRKAVRTAMGAVLDLPWAIAPRGTLLEVVRGSGCRVLALTPATDALPLDEAVTACDGARVAFLVGNEGTGLAARTLAESDVRVRIPMASGADSLNVATALAVALYAFRAAGPAHRGPLRPVVV